MGRHTKNPLEVDAGDIATLPSDYAERLALARLKEVEQNAERLRLENVKKNIDIEKTSCNLCYIEYAESEINRALGPIANLVKNLDQILATRLNLSGAQTAIVQSVVDDVLRQISLINIELKSTEEIDAENAHRALCEKEKSKRDIARANRKSRK